MQNILYKTLFTTNFIENTYKLYNFVGITCQLKFLENIAEKKSFLANFFNKFVKKIM